MSAPKQTRTEPNLANPDVPLPAFTCALSAGRFGSVSVHPSGELDLATAPLLDKTLREAQFDARVVVLDLRKLDFMDSAGVHVIVDAAERARQEGRRLVVLRGPARVDRVFMLTGTADVLEISDRDPWQPPTDHEPWWVAATNEAAPS